MRTIPYAAVFLLTFSSVVAEAQAEEAAIFDFVGDSADVNPVVQTQLADRLSTAQRRVVQAVGKAGVEPLDVSDARVQGVVDDKTIGEVRFAAFRLDGLLKAAQADSPTIAKDGPLSGVPISDLAITELPDGVRNVTARVGRERDGNLALVVSQEGAAGVIQHDDVVYQVRHLYGRWHAFATPNESFSGRRFEDDVAKAGAGEESDDGNEGDQTCGPPPTDEATIDLLVAYTPTAKAKAGAATVDVETQISVATVISNLAFKNSAVMAELNLLKVAEVNYSEAATYDDDLQKLKSGTSGLSGVVSDRKALKADAVILVVHNDDPRECGLADGINVGKRNAFAIVNWQCLSNKFSFAHEIGHLAGARHDHDADPDPPMHAHGFRNEKPDDNRFCTIMATQGTCGPAGSGRIWNWSNPNVLHKGIATGTVDRHNNACVWNTNARRMAGFDGG